MSTLLEGAGIAAFEGFAPAHLDPRPDLVVVGNAVRRDNPEAVECERLAIPRLSMPEALARHDAISRAAVAGHRGRVVKTTGDGVHAVFDDPLDAVAATIEMQQALADSGATGGIALHVRCGIHAGVEEARDDDFFGRSVNRAARIMSVAHGGQVLLSQAVASLVEERLRLHPEDTRALYMAANGLVALGDRERGLAWARRARAVAPDDSMVLYNVGCIEALAGNADEACSPG